MKKNIKVICIASVVSAMLAGCGSTTTSTQQNNNTTAEATSDIDENVEKLKIIATTFPEYDWIRELLGENIKNVDLSILLDTGVDLHNFSPSVEDIIKISTCDMFVYIGGESTNTWIDGVLAQTKNDDMIIIDLMEELGDLVQVSEFEHDHDHDHDHDEEDHDHDHDEEDHDHDHDEEDHDHDHDEEDHDHDHDEEDHDHDHNEEDHDHDHDEEDHDHDHDEEEHDHDHDHDEEDHDHDHNEEDHDHDHDEEDHDHDHDHDEEDHDHDHDDEDHDHDHDHDEDCDDEDCDHEDHFEDDEHIWLSLVNAQVLCRNLEGYLSELDPANADLYEANRKAYVKELEELHQEYEDVVAKAETDILVVADRFPFLYLTIDYDLEYYAAFSGCSSETEASFETIISLANAVDEFDLSYILTTETGNPIADTVLNSTKAKTQEIVALNSMQSTVTKDGDTYLSIMRENLEVLEEVLSK